MGFAEGEFSIGEISDLFDMDTQTLRYYDSLGLFSPRIRNENTRIRRYPFEQAYQLAAIRFMRQMGCPIKQVQKYIQSEDVDSSLEMLREQSERLGKQWKMMQQQQSALDLKIELTQKKLDGISDLHQIVVKQYPERRYLLIGGEDTLYRDILFYLAPTLVFRRGDKKWFAARISKELEEIFPLGEEGANKLKSISAGRFLCGYHAGPYTTTGETEKRMRENAAGMKLSDDALFVNIVDMFVQNDPQKFISEVQIEILEE